MANPTDEKANQGADIRSLQKAIAKAKNRLADTSDVVVDMKAAERARLQLLAEELQPIVLEVDPEDGRFEFALTKGDRPRFWVDMTTFVSMGHDKRQFRLLKDTRMGRMVLAETDDLTKMADFVADYVAEKVVEREHMLEGEWQYLKDKTKKSEDAPAAPSNKNAAPVKRKGGFWRSFTWFLFGALSCVALLLAAAFVLVPEAF